MSDLRASILGRRRRGLRHKSRSTENGYRRLLSEQWPSAALATRDAYESSVNELVAEGVDVAPPLALRLASFACERDLPEQVASIRSFLIHAGTPADLTIVSDGSHSAWSRDLLEALHPCVSVVDWRSISRQDLPRTLWDYAEANWRGRKLLVMVSLVDERRVLWADADVLFFPCARELREVVGPLEAHPRYLRDCEDGAFLDPEMLASRGEAAGSVNAGFVFLPRPIEWSSAVRRLEERLRSGRTTFTAQTVVHLALHAADARPFEPSRYVMAVDDRELADDAHVGPETVMRHYVMPVRHKFWTTLARSSAVAR